MVSPNVLAIMADFKYAIGTNLYPNRMRRHSCTIGGNSVKQQISEKTADEKA